MSLLLQILVSFVLGLCLADQFSPDRSNHDLYGPAMATNRFMFVQAENAAQIINVQFAPFDDAINTNNDRLCNVPYEDPLWYIYTIALGKNQSSYHFFFVGEVLDLEETDNITNRTFVVLGTYTGSPTTINCTGFIFDVQYVPDVSVHQDYLVMTADPLGLVAYGYSPFFSFTYTAATNGLVINQNNTLSPLAPFLPVGIDYDGNRGIIAGFLGIDDNGLMTYTPTVILFSVNMLTVVAESISNWSYPIGQLTSETRLDEQAFDQYAAKLDMSVSINPGATQVLVGIQWLNIVLLLQYTTTNLTLLTLKDNGQATVGFGKDVAWLGDSGNSFAILFNIYSRDYQVSSSRIYIYDSPLTDSSKPITIFPNIQQPLYSYLSSTLLYIVTTPVDLVLLETSGRLFFILSAPSGYYPSTSGPDYFACPAASTNTPCVPGAYKNTTGIARCALCPAGTKSDGSKATLTACADCGLNTFCPLGSVTDSIPGDDIVNVIQTVAYPKSPDVSGLDDILFFTLFSIGSDPRCVVLSPVFWALIITAVFILITAIMLIIKHCVANSLALRISSLYESIFKSVDLIREGEMWAGGIATITVIVLCISCCVFSVKFYASYPIETAEPSTYTCDTSLRNAQFSTSLQSSSIPVSGGLQEMIDLLNDQAVNLNIALIDTIYDCESTKAALTFLPGANVPAISLDPSCEVSNYVVYYSAPLPFRQITVQFTVSNIYTIGGLRIGLSAPGSSESSTITIQDLGFSYTFNKTGRVLGQNIYITQSLTKVINSTSPLSGGNDEVLSGIWTGSFSINYNNSFISNADYLMTLSDATEILLTLVISETPYYILNEQSPIARLPEIIYHDFLFITMIIGMFVLLFIVVEVTILPCFASVDCKCKRKSGRIHPEETSPRSSISHGNSRKKDYTQHNRKRAILTSIVVKK